MHAASEGQHHGAKCLLLQGFQPQGAAQAPLRAATFWSLNSQRIRLRAGALASPVWASPLTIKPGVRSLHFWWPPSPAGFSSSKPALTPVNRPSPGFFPHPKSDFYETEEYSRLLSVPATRCGSKCLWLRGEPCGRTGRLRPLSQAKACT